ncbi:MAG: hypothetical protein AAB955_02740 [Patescibacteria group bacterium]
MSTTKIIFNTPKKLKEALAKKARKQGLTMSAVFNLAAQAYVDDRIVLSTFERDLLDGLADAKAGRVTPQEEVFRELGL